jgi:pyruvate/2-oxoglutarate dehydrogenase complex dihydrolipoamide acyltransferase (E2) component
VVDTSRALPIRAGSKKPTFVDTPLSDARSSIARSLTASKNTIPHSYLSASIPAKNIQLLLRRMVLDGEEWVSLDDFLIKASALALRVR